MAHMSQMPGRVKAGTIMQKPGMRFLLWVESPLGNIQMAKKNGMHMGNVSCRSEWIGLEIGHISGNALMRSCGLEATR